MQFTSAQMAALGEAVMLADQDLVYIACQQWALVFVGAEHHFSTDALELLEVGLTHRAPVDWRALNAREVFFKERQFLPDRGSHSLPLLRREYQFSQLTPTLLRQRMEAPELWGDFYALDRMFRDGAMRVEYARQQSMRFASEDAASRYTFQLEDRKMLAVTPAHFRAFIELGFSIGCPVDKPKWLALRHPTPSIFGVLRTHDELGRRTTLDGRELYLDAMQVAWKTPEEGLKLLCTDYSERTPPTKRVRTHASHELLMGVAILRWHGLTDSQIDQLYEEHAPSAWERR